MQVFAPPGQKGAEYDQDDAKLDPVAAGHQHADADERGNCRGDIQRAATPGRGDQTGEVGDQVVFVLVLVEVQDAVIGCGLLLERDLDLVGCFGGNEVALCVCHALWTPIAAGSPYGLL